MVHHAEPPRFPTASVNCRSFPSPLTAQLSVGYPIDQVPVSEYLVNMMERAQLFLKYPVRPRGGCLDPGEAPGCQMDVDEDKVEREAVVAL